jgi:magnesium transporter
MSASELPIPALGSAAAFESAASLATDDIPVAYREDRIGQLRERIAQRRFASVSSIPVIDAQSRCLYGVLSIEEILAAPGDARVRDLMDDDPPCVSHQLDREHAAWKAVQHGESALAVIDDEGRFVGVIPPQRLLAALLAEHDEDLSRIGGFLKSSEAARHATTEPMRHRLWHRLPWLLIGLLGALLAARIVGSFERTLSEIVLLAAFVPGIIYFADAVGTQTETVVVRGLSLGIAVRQMLLREAATGIIIGAATALLVYPAVLLGWHDARVAWIVSLSLLAACSVATVVALVLPVLLSRIGVDPAFGAGPLATVIQDLLSLLIYFGIATMMIA